MVKSKKKEILIETGTNELEVLEFTIADRHFGINVAKVVELLPFQEVTPMPNASPYVEGVFRPRTDVLTLINLAAYLGLPDSENTERHIFITTNFNSHFSAFHVHTVEAIHRISWEKIEKPDPSIYGGEDGLATGIARIDGKLIMIVDFEKILSDISPSTGIQISDLDQLGERARNVKPILIAEDSPLLEKLIIESLHKAGYSNITSCANGKEAWDKLESYKATGNPISDYVTCVITDIEMPQMDGHRLTKLIKEDEVLKILPVIIFSSLINPEMRIKGESLGATAQITKPEINSLVMLLDEHVI